ncbi:DNA polymerase III, delta' subunit [Mariprofundus ferrinatatus]|uniref:DNA polymerase III, delta' subunit n=1 Tax=Mariprofundus ferrinatatus TaxID=1921087 RepID=A0A2K8L445_9PROT|nr:DNA polymerase III subunit [Mariprofundus ferrinatatus]ATX82090.1 DNA polymerase III, delta' subunit [Mariprofundus ferrinatatus]
MKEVLGHQAIESRFREAMARGRVHHAWLLHGVSGIGKFALAEKLAAMLLCEHQSACGECHPCQMFRAGSHPDLFTVGLLEKKRDISIDQVRELLGFLALSGAEGEQRVVILDEAERLNNQSANALLKGLEEPSAGSVLIMVCSDAMKLPATVRSRCLMQHCSPLCDDDVRTVLSAKLDADMIDLAVKLADGCPGSVSCLEDDKVAHALSEWQGLVANVTEADVGRIENWCRQHVVSVPHELIIRALLQPVYPRLQAYSQSSFEAVETLHRSVRDCLRWPGDVIRQSLRASPTLLCCVLELRTALRTAG